jgi:hypothetical protein
MKFVLLQLQEDPMTRDGRDQDRKPHVAPEGLRRDQHQEEQERLPPRIGALKPEDEERAQRKGPGNR